MIIFDQRGIGLSDRAKGFPDLDTRMDDLRAVLDAAGSERTVLWGGGVDGGALCAMFAATHPERTIALAFWNAVARTSVAPDYPWGDSAEEIAEFEQLVAEGWGRDDGIAEIMRRAGGPSLVEDEASIRWTARATRYMASPGGMLAFDEMYDAIDFRSVLPSIHVPTLCLMAPQSDLAAGGYADLAARVAGAKTVTLPGSDQHPPWPYNTEAAVSTLHDFITDVRDHEAGLDRVLATVLFTDVVDGDRDRRRDGRRGVEQDRRRSPCDHPCAASQVPRERGRHGRRWVLRDVRRSRAGGPVRRGDHREHPRSRHRGPRRRPYGGSANRRGQGGRHRRLPSAPGWRRRLNHPRCSCRRR